MSNNTNEALKMYNTIFAMQSINADCIEKAKDIFTMYKNQGVIVRSNFENKRWQLCDEYSNVGIIFTVDEVSYSRHYKDIFNISCSQFVDYVKAYTLFQMGDWVSVKISDSLIRYKQRQRSLSKCQKIAENMMKSSRNVQFA